MFLIEECYLEVWREGDLLNIAYTRWEHWGAWMGRSVN